ncbi:MAG: hypothetical protein U0Q07_02125 [Acidimicrobiales bacterium]
MAASSASTTAPAPTLLEAEGNVAVVRGVLSRDPRATALASGSIVVQLDVTVHEGGAPASSVPVAWFDPPASAASLVAGREVVVVGRVVRRFFRTPGGTGSRTEVVADRVVPASARARVRTAVAGAAARLGAEVT